MIILLLMLQIEWQAVNRPYSDTEQELIVYYTIPITSLHSKNVDNALYVEYETQLTVFDSKKRQLNGDYWERSAVVDTADIQDSVSMIISKRGDYYELRIIDLLGGVILSTSGSVIPIRYIGNIIWDMQGDSAMIAFTVLNEEGTADSLVIGLENNQASTAIKQGTYEDTLALNVSDIANGHYPMKIDLYYRSLKVDGIRVPVTIARVFYLDEQTWVDKVEQLEYIASSSEMSVLKKAMIAERESLWHTFWRQHDPTPHTEYNEMEVQYFERIAYCEEHFSHGDRGWRSDRARIYIKYGPPDEIQRYPYHLGPPKSISNPVPTLYDAYIVWIYYQLNREFLFGDKHGLGEYVLISSGY